MPLDWEYKKECESETAMSHLGRKNLRTKITQEEEWSLSMELDQAEIV